MRYVRGKLKAGLGGFPSSAERGKRQLPAALSRPLAPMRGNPPFGYSGIGHAHDGRLMTTFPLCALAIRN
ncbi:hypothetical protein CBR_g39567 [Chara braunii]|uniref:Uncharacterized protein n=1 Tax=Chara braunii TaxID=69332 RepID=A0A388LRZ2_CHABU|nr:hypothetical protein CBR_g39567 [Chara braunii]|eukprot:GBG85108.1 hypothetical protein CBR_g39567 [Chara braunii]